MGIMKCETDIPAVGPWDSRRTHMTFFMSWGAARWLSQVASWRTRQPSIKAFLAVVSPFLSLWFHISSPAVGFQGSNCTDHLNIEALMGSEAERFAEWGRRTEGAGTTQYFPSRRPCLSLSCQISPKILNHQYFPILSKENPLLQDNRLERV